MANDTAKQLFTRLAAEGAMIAALAADSRRCAPCMTWAKTGAATEPP